LCLLAAQNVRVNKDTGVFTLFGNSYYSAVSSRVAGQVITVRFDPQRLHSSVYIYKLSGEVLGEAECRLATGFNDSVAAREMGRFRSQNLKNARKIEENEIRMGIREVNEALPVVPASPSLISSKVVRLIRPPIEAPAAILDDVCNGKSGRRLQYESYIAIPEEQRTAAQRFFIKFYENGGEESFPRFGVIG
jgi:putative transposase